MRVLASVFFILIAFILFVIIAVKEDQYQSDKITIQHSVKSDQTGKCLCYTILDGTFSIDSNGYWSTDVKNFQADQLIYTVTFDNYQTSYENLEKFGKTLAQEVNSVSTKLEGLSSTDAIIYLTTYQFKSNNPFPTCTSTDRYQEQGTYSVTLDISPIDFMKKLSLQSLSVKKRNFGGSHWCNYNSSKYNYNDLHNINYDDDENYKLPKHKFIPQSIIQSYLSGENKWLYNQVINGYGLQISNILQAKDDDEVGTFYSPKEYQQYWVDDYNPTSLNFVGSVWGNYMSPWDVQFIDNDMLITLEYQMKTRSEPVLKQKMLQVDGGDDEASTLPFTLPQLLSFGQYPGENLLIDEFYNDKFTSSFSINLNTIFVAMAINRGLISKKGYEQYKCTDISTPSTGCKLQDINDDDNNMVPLIISSGLDNAAIGLNNVNISCFDNHRKSLRNNYIQWMELGVPFKYQLYQDEMDNIYCVQNKTYLAQVLPGETFYAANLPSNFVSTSLSDDQVACGVYSGGKILIPYLGGFNYSFSFLFTTDYPEFNTNTSGDGFALNFIAIDPTDTTSEKTVGLNSGYIVARFKVIQDPKSRKYKFLFTKFKLPTFDTSATNNPNTFWQSSPIDGGDTQNLYFCYEDETTVFVNSMSSAYSTILLLNVFLLPTIVFIFVWLIRYYYGNDVAQIFYHPLASNEALDDEMITKNEEKEEDDHHAQMV